MIESALKDATKTIPIYWPLPSFIATNPLWDLHEQPLQEVLYSLKNIAGVEGVMPLSFYQEMFIRDKIKADHLDIAIEEYLKKNIDARFKENLKKTLTDFILESSTKRDCLVSQPILVAEKLSTIFKKNMSDRIRKSIIQFFMIYFSHINIIENNGLSDGLFCAWRRQIARYDNELWDITSEIELDKGVAVNHLLNEFRIQVDKQAKYFKKIFYSLLGWSSFIKWLEQRPDNPYFKQSAQLIDLVLIWLCYEKYFYRKCSQPLLPQDNEEYDNNQNIPDNFKYRFIWQRAFEIAYERQLMSKLITKGLGKITDIPSKPVVQAIFCIDTRSEGIRRYLEKMAGYETFGFAGFFGFVFNYQNTNDRHSLQCPALFAPEIYLKNEREKKYLTKQIEHFFSSCHKTQKSLFSPMVFVDISGFWFSFLMCIKSYSSTVFKKCRQFLGLDNNENKLQEIISSKQVNAAFTLEIKVKNAKQFLMTIGLTKNFAPIILICGHGGETDNNPYQASFDCGACGGNAGFPNAIVATHILNDVAVRKKLKSFDIHIPDESYFVAGFHNTTRDHISLYEKDLPHTIKSKLPQLKKDLALACHDLRHERSRELPGASFAKERAADWAELIPEMGLMNNAALIVGPRYLTQHISLERRVFLHSYDPQLDPDGQLLTGILFGPLIVAHWINAQYYFSTTDPTIYGSGNKMLHNVLPNIGVIEGNLSDLRIGLPWQGVSFQNKTLHQPLRLLVIIYARKKLVDQILEQHASIKALFTQQWAHLKVIEPGD